jgi:hypothetical protein
MQTHTRRLHAVEFEAASRKRALESDMGGSPIYRWKGVPSRVRANAITELYFLYGEAHDWLRQARALCENVAPRQSRLEAGGPRETYAIQDKAVRVREDGALFRHAGKW